MNIKDDKCRSPEPSSHVPGGILVHVTECSSSSNNNLYGQNNKPYALYTKQQNIFKILVVVAAHRYCFML